MAMTGDTPEDAAVQDTAELDKQLSRLPDTIIQTLSREQKEAVATALDASLSGYPVDIRLTVPFFGGSYFVTTISSKERRSDKRRAKEREARPLVTFGNLLFSIIFAFIIFVGVLVIGFTALFMLR